MVTCCAVLLGAMLSGCGNDGTSGDTAAPTTNTISAATSSTAIASNTLTPPSPATSSSSTISGATPGSVSLAWQPPVQNTDGTTASEVTGYEIHYGTTSMDYTATIQVSGAANTAYVIQDLSPATYYFAVTAYDTVGEESSLSPEISAIVN